MYGTNLNFQKRKNKDRSYSVWIILSFYYVWMQTLKKSKLRVSGSTKNIAGRHGHLQGQVYSQGHYQGHVKVTHVTQRSIIGCEILHWFIPIYRIWYFLNTLEREQTKFCNT